MLKVYFRAFFHPAEVFRELVDSGRAYKSGFVFITFPIIGYTLLYIFLTLAQGAPSSFTPWLNIPKEDYYAANRFLLAPSFIMAWIAAGGLMHMIARAAGGTGNFENTLGVIATATSIAMWGALVHDLPMSFLSAVGVINAKEHEIAMNSATIWRTLLWSAYSVYLVAFLVLFPAAIRAAHRLPRLKAALIGWLGFAVFQAIFFVFNR